MAHRSVHATGLNHCLFYYSSLEKQNRFESNIKDFIFGVGPDSFGYWFETKNIVIPAEGSPFIGAIFTNAHNDLFTMTVNLGIPGMMIYICVFISLALSAIKSISDKDEITWAVPALLLIICYMANNMFSFQTVCSTPIFFIVISLLLTSKKTSEKP